MTIIEIPKLRALWRGIFLFLICLSAMLACATPHAELTKDEIFHMEAYGQSFDGFRFYVSHDVTLVHRAEEIDPDYRRTVFRDTVIRTEVRLSKKTPGRRQFVSGGGGIEDNILYVAFEERNRKPLPIAFVQKRSGSRDERFYFLWQTDPETREQYIDYDDGRYEVIFNEDEEPYLMYSLTAKEKRQTRRMHGIR